VPRITTVFFDFGGTLAHTVSTRAGVIQRSLRQLGHDFPIEEIQRVLAAGNAWRRAHEHECGEDWPSRSAFYVNWYTEVARLLGLADPAAVGRHLWDTQDDSYELFPETAAALAALDAQGLKLGVISNWDKLNLVQACETLGIARHFRVMLPSAEAEADKPNPAIFRLALQRIGSQPGESLMVGDSYPADVAGSEAVGLTGVLVLRDGEWRGPDCLVVRRLDEIPTRLPML